MRHIIAATLAAAALTGCVAAIPPVEVTRFHRLDAPMAGLSGSYRIVPAATIDAPPAPGEIRAPVGDLAWQTYAAGVARQLERLGATPAAAGASTSDYLVTLGVERSQRDSGSGRSPVSVGVGAGGGGGGGYSGGGVGLGIGFNLGGGSREQIVSRITVRINRGADQQAIWEGRAENVAPKRSPAAQPGLAADKLATALFMGFPGQSGATISVP